jgi:CheY-like chemotaxis protein/HPt (histidine-containing phosphotransfer) domain-containing protein
VKFTPEGGRVELAARPLGPPDAAGLVPLRIEVRDTGPGVPEAQRGAIFGDFVQLDRGKAGGTGLGLAIAAGIAGQMGGRIGCEANARSRTGQGATFWVELALRPAAAAMPARPAAAALPRRSLNVLVADDVPANLAVARALLQSVGHTVHCVADGTLAVRAVREAPAERPFDVVLMDVMMPNLDGMGATRQIRALPGPMARVPILAVTASAFTEDIEACRAAGMDAHLAKPIEREALIAALGRLTGEAPPPAAAALPPEPEDFERIPLLSRRAGAPLELPGLDPVAARSLAAEFVRELREAAEQLRGIDGSLPDRMVPAAHRLAGAAATLGATRLATAARQFQDDARRLPAEAMLRLRRGLLEIAAESIAALDVPADDTPDGDAKVAVAG